MAGLTMQGTPSLRLPGEHFAAALLFLAVGSVGLVWIAPELAAGLYLSPHVAGVTHCFTLGWLSMTIFGALYQLLPVALGVPIRSERAGHLSFWSFAPGVALFASGVAFSLPSLRYAGIALISVGVVSVVINVGLSLRRVETRDVIWAAVAIGLTFLTTTLVLGAVLAENLRAGFLGAWRVRVLATHLHIALLGWVLMMIVGISHRLLPMFLLSHTASTTWTRRALSLLSAGVLILGCALIADHRIPYVPIPWVGLILIEAGVLCFLVQAVLFFRARKRPRLDAGLRHAACALCFLAIAAGMGPIVLAHGAGYRNLDTAYVLVGLLGGLTLYVIGQFYKIVPFLAWMARFRDDMGRRPVPTVAQLYSARAAHAGLVLLVTGITGMATAVMMSAEPVARVAALLVAAGVALFISQMVRVVFGTSFGGVVIAPSSTTTRISA